MLVPQSNVTKKKKLCKIKTKTHTVLRSVLRNAETIYSVRATSTAGVVLRTPIYTHSVSLIFFIVRTCNLRRTIPGQGGGGGGGGGV